MRPSRQAVLGPKRGGVDSFEMPRFFRETRVEPLERRLLVRDVPDDPYARHGSRNPSCRAGDLSIITARIHDPRDFVQISNALNRVPPPSLCCGEAN
jgi:hypothetical protein